MEVFNRFGGFGFLRLSLAFRCANHGTQRLYSNYRKCSKPYRTTSTRSLSISDTKANSMTSIAHYIQAPPRRIAQQVPLLQHQRRQPDIEMWSPMQQGETNL